MKVLGNVPKRLSSVNALLEFYLVLKESSQRRISHQRSGTQSLPQQWHVGPRWVNYGFHGNCVGMGFGWVKSAGPM